MNCCCEEELDDCTYGEYLDNPLNYQSILKPIEVPQLKIALDLPHDSDYLTTYWPGQEITGQLSIQINQPVNIYHLHIVLFGHVQVYGDCPGQSFMSSLFDHVQNEQLIYTGVRVNHQLETCPVYPLMNNKIKKSQHDRYIENLVKKVATLDHRIQGNNHLPLIYHPTQCDHTTFELQTSHTVDFAIRVPSQSVHSFEHPHFPITYRVVAFMHGRISDNDVVCHSTKKIRLESLLQPFKVDHVPDPAYQYIHQQHQTLFQNLYTKLLSRSYHLSQWVIRQHRITPTCYLKAYGKAPGHATKGDFLPCTVVLENHAFDVFSVTAVRLRVELYQRIRLACSLNEEVEHTVVQSFHVELRNETHHDTLLLEMPRLLKIPEECVCSFDAVSTRDIVSLEYDVAIHVSVMGEPDTITRSSSHSVYLDGHHLIDEPKDAWKYTWKLNSLPVFISNKKLA